MNAPQSNEKQDIRPSHFANLGQPCCSRWGKSEIEWIALAYVQALANDGDTWKKLTREQTYQLLTKEQKRDAYGVLTDDFEPYARWFDAVSDQITDAEGALGVRGFWNEYRLKELLSALRESQP
jgi:hypothetical protein